MKSSLAAATFSVVSLTCALAFAQVDLEWKAPRGCPQEDEVRERLGALAGPLARSAELRAEAEVDRDGDHFRLRLRVMDGAEVRERVIVAESCSDLAGAAAVALVFLLKDASDSGSPSGAGDGEPSGTSSGAQQSSDSNAARTPASSSSPEPLPKSEEPERWDLLIQVPVLALDFGPLQKPSPAFGMGAGVRWDAWRLVARGALGLSQSLAVDSPGAGAKVRRASLAFSACRGWPFNPFEISPCLVLALEHLEARGVGSDIVPRSDGVFWLAPGAEVAVHFPISEGLNLFSGISGRFEAAQPRIVIEGRGALHQLGPFSLGALIGAEWIP